MPITLEPTIKKAKKDRKQILIAYKAGQGAYLLILFKELSGNVFIKKKIGTRIRTRVGWVPDFFQIGITPLTANTVTV